jgi:ferric-dicitrate binding protein FerR (iron transport regulator)
VGEIYLEVVKDRKPFIVNTSDMNITVYGTAFNVSAYADRYTPSVVLVEGKVGVKNTLSGEDLSGERKHGNRFIDLNKLCVVNWN